MLKSVLKPLIVGLFMAGHAFVYNAAIADAALLEGKVIQVSLHHMTTPSGPSAIIDSGDFVVGPDVELPGFGAYDRPRLPALVDIDVSDRQILITLLSDQPPALRDDLIFKDSHGVIPGSFTDKVTINPVTNWDGFNDSLAQDAGEAILVILGGLHGLAGQFILLDVVPEPASIALLACAVPAGLLLRRRRQERSNCYGGAQSLRSTF